MPTATATPIRMPQLGESVTEGTIGAWLRKPGDLVEKYDPLVEVESDKASSELPAPVGGRLVEILVEPGTTVPVGTTLCTIAEPGSGNGTSDEPHANSVIAAPADVTAPDEMTLLRTRSSPFVRRTAEEFGIDLGCIEGTGVGGRVTKRDVLAAVESMRHATPPASAPEATRPAAPAPMATALPTAHRIEPLPGDEVIPVSAMRRAIAQNTWTSVQTAPHATCVMEVDMTGVVAWRAAHKEEFRRREDVDLTYLPVVLRAVCVALRDHPRLNAVWDETRIIHRGEINLGVAVALDDGLVVPVIRNADRLSVTGLAHALADLTGRSRAGSLGADDFAGGTFTVNNPGTFGSIVSTPILVQPQVGIMSTEAIVKRPVVIDDMMAIRSMMNLSLTIDHRALDGLAATRFLAAVKDWLEAVTAETSLG
jgi:2-oxoisovalerate dehydrogenase E2 component (dihydrolipoyl transacylase)